ASAASAKAEIASDKADIAIEKSNIATAAATTAAEIVSSKANKDMDNLSTTGKNVLVNLLTPDYEHLIENNNSAPETYIATQDCYVCAKGSTLAYDLYKDNTSILVEFLYSSTYSSAWAFLPKGFKLVRRSTSQYNNFVIVPLKAS
ncbi:MAG: hypothetical protein ACI4RJ_02020, partial [Alphaproteobacteria bacterium]